MVKDPDWVVKVTRIFCESSGWFVVGAPKSTPTEIIEEYNKEINAALANPKLKARQM